MPASKVDMAPRVLGFQRQSGVLPVLDFLLPWAATTPSGTLRTRTIHASATASQVENLCEAGPSHAHRVAKKETGAASQPVDEVKEGHAVYGMATLGNQDLLDRGEILDDSPPAASSSLAGTTAYRPPWRRKSLLPHLQPRPSSTIPRLNPPQRTPNDQANSSPRPNQDPISTSLSRFNPPSPINMFDHLRTDVPGLSKQRGELVARYAARMGNLRMERVTRDLMGRMRLGPLHWVKRDRPRRKRPPEPADPVESFLEPGAINPSADPSLDTPLPPPPEVQRPPRSLKTPIKIASSRTFTRDIPAHLLPGFNPPLSSITSRSITSLLPLRSQVADQQPQNAWASNRWPITDVIRGTASFRHPDDILAHLHHLLLHDPQHAPDIRNAFAIGARILRSAESRLEFYQDVLHLYLAYTPTLKHGMMTLASLKDILDSALLLQPNLKPTRQTLHLLILRALSATPRREDVSTSIRELLQSFEGQWHVGPGCETLRHIAQYALRIRDYELAQESWEAWWKEYARMCSLADLEAMDSLRGGFQDQPQNMRGDGSGDVKFRFRRRGRQLARWWQVVRELERRGWIERIELEGQEEEPTRYRWVGRPVALIQDVSQVEEAEAPTASSQSA